MKPDTKLLEEIEAKLVKEGLLSDFDEEGETVPPDITIKGNVIRVYAAFNDAAVDWDDVANCARRAATCLWNYQKKYGKLGIQFVLACDADGPGGYFDFTDLKMSKVTSDKGIDLWVRANAPEDDEDAEDVDERRLNENTKVTLTLKQLKRLVKETGRYDDEDGQEPGIPQMVEPAIDNHLCEMIAEIANNYFDMDVDDYETRAIADEQLDSIYTSMRSLALKWLKAVKDSK